MLEIDIPGWRRWQLETIVLDLNGTITVDGGLLPVQAAIVRLRRHPEVQRLSADTNGTLDLNAAELGVVGFRLSPLLSGSEQKAQHVRQLSPGSAVAIDDGSNDVGMFELTARAVVVVGSAESAPARLLEPRRLIATLRR